ncbi:DNA-processing protein DprA [Pantanalinema sp. GBBB05]|uniref:DNA-processing protein DprA n=1 Tax=Pantanalinema sp. GBBB05 TaxID=2604139 RepID=UPI001D29AEF8|nr:DNA-protecting protein DprA [Pantanalinema sp. GBBB05]
MVKERAFWLAWSQLHGVGPILLKRLQQQFGTLSTAWSAKASALMAVEGVGQQSAEAIVAQRQQYDPETFLAEHEQANPDFWTPADADYPRLLLEIPDPPAVLYYQGLVDLQENLGQVPMIAIVGTRSPSEYGRRWTRRLSSALAKQGFTVVSGLAQGVDTEAHRSCLQVGGRTLAVVGTGVDVVYPWSNRQLCQQVMAQGLVLSEYPAGTQPDRVHFPRRNRIIAGLSRATLILEAPERSGALITAHLANDYGRDVYVLPGNSDNPRSLGCLKLWNNGAQGILGEDHLLDLLGTLPQLPPSAAKSVPDQIALPFDLPVDLTQVLQALTEIAQRSQNDAVQLDQLAPVTNLNAGEISSALLQLELMGLVVQLPGMRYQRH